MELVEAMELAGVQKAVIWRYDTVIAGNKRLADDIKNIDNLYGVWTLLPSHTHELPEPETMLKTMKQSRIIGWRLLPDLARYLPKVFGLRDWLATAYRNHIPLFVNTAHGTSLEALVDMLEVFPEPYGHLDL